MLKVRIPYSLVIMLSLTAGWSLIAGLLAAAITETVCAVLLFLKLRSEEAFDYESWYGQYLSQLTVLGEIHMMDIVHLVSARVASYVVAAIMLYAAIPVGFLAIPSILYLLTIIHIV